MIKHTEGPWSCSEQRGIPGHCMVAQIWDSQGNALASVEPSVDQDQATATARLIAAAPELLSALDSLVSACDLPGDHCEVEQALPRAIAAIKKAKGQQ
jgi:hypothetical protein